MIWIGLGVLFCVIIVILVILAVRKEPEKRIEENGWKIYCVNKAETKVVSEGFFMQEAADEVEEQIECLLDAMRTEPGEYTNLKAIPDRITLKEWVLVGNQLTLDFDVNYANITGISEILRRTAIVKTLCQIEGVDFVSFTVAGQPLMDSNAQPIGMMSSSDFIDNTGGETNYKQTVTLNLFFTGEDGRTLKVSRHQIEFDGTISLEELVIEQLIAGPLPEEHLYPTLPSDAKLLKVSKKEGICYVDFDSSFLNKLPEVSDEVAIYSVVNSLTEISGVSQVQFTINGESQKLYRENIPFDGLFERNLDLVDTVN